MITKNQKETPTDFSKISRELFIREIGELAGLKSTATVQYYVDELIKMGLLATDAKPGTPRAIRVVGYQYVKISESEEKECQKQE